MYETIPGSVCTKLPTIKSKPASNKIRSKINCNFITHFTPATLIMLSNKTAAHAIDLTAHLESPNPISSAIDSPKPKTFRAHPTA